MLRRHMKTFSIYAHPSGAVKAIKKGFSWPGAFFGCIWAFAKQLWLVGFSLIVAVMVVEMIIAQVLAVSPEVSQSPGLLTVVRLFDIVGPLVVGFVVGWQGNNWRGKKLRARGYTLTQIVDAATPEAAIAQCRAVLTGIETPGGGGYRPCAR
jgi:hypothetical protein